jgi:nitroreductase
MAVDSARLAMPIGEAMFTQRSIRRLKPDPIPTEDLQLILEAASKALYREAWWAKRRDEGRPWTRREEIPPEEKNSQAAARLADEIVDAPCIVLAFGAGKGQASSVIPAVQNLMLAARALGVGSVPTTLHPTVMDRVRALLDVPPEAEFHLCIPLGYPRGRFGPTQRRPTHETTYLDRWGAQVPWAPTEARC